VDKKKNIAIKIEVIECFHTVPCVGYIMSSQKSKIKPEYRNVAGRELGELRKKGVQISENVWEPQLAFLGDTTTKVFKANPELVKTPYIMIECTLFKDGDEGKAKGGGHVHWNKLKPIATANPKVTFILIHFSKKYRDKEIIDFFENQECGGKPPHNIALWLDSGVKTWKKIN